MLHNKKSPIVPIEWTGDMFKDEWHESLFQVREEIARSLDKFHQEETKYLNSKLKTNDKTENSCN